MVSPRRYEITFVRDVGGVLYTNRHANHDWSGIVATCAEDQSDLVEVSWARVGEGLP
jgi:hypothetical protein